ncbi:MAG: Obg family GTPase CgtA [Dehalococcoidia bacterium]|nr:Obg family GTPase CgtA [Dehalococcoidia bacterium]
MIGNLKLVLKAGDGGDGVVSFRREKFVPHGGPAGGNGGKGGDVVLRTDRTVLTLGHLSRKRVLKAENGKPGAGSLRQGGNGEDLIVNVPPGTRVRVEGGYAVDLLLHGQEILVAEGGRGGHGNARFKSPVNQTPRVAQRGEKGVEKIVYLEAQLNADVVILGLPNSGKSTLLNRLTGSRARVAEYPCTTTEPVPGMYVDGAKDYLLMEIPGLGVGGPDEKEEKYYYLHSIDRVKVLLFLVDGSAEDPAGDVENVEKQLENTDEKLLEKRRIIAVNKMDVTGGKTGPGVLRSVTSKTRRDAYYISALTGDGITELMREVVRRAEEKPGPVPEKEAVINLPVKGSYRARVYRSGDVTVIEHSGLAGILERTDISNPDAQKYLKAQFSSRGVLKMLKKTGIKVGDKVRCGEVEWHWRWIGR